MRFPPISHFISLVYGDSLQMQLRVTHIFPLHPLALPPHTVYLRPTTNGKENATAYRNYKPTGRPANIIYAIHATFFTLGTLLPALYPLSFQLETLSHYFLFSYLDRNACPLGENAGYLRSPGVMLGTSDFHFQLKPVKRAHLAATAKRLVNCKDPLQPQSPSTDLWLTRILFCFLKIGRTQLYGARRREPKTT